MMAARVHAQSINNSLNGGEGAILLAYSAFYPVEARRSLSLAYLEARSWPPRASSSGSSATVAGCGVWSPHLGVWGPVVKQFASSVLSTSARFVAGAIVFVRLLFPNFCLLVACVCGLLGYSEVLVRRGSGLWVWLASLWLCVLEPRSTAQNGWRCCFTY